MLRGVVAQRGQGVGRRPLWEFQRRDCESFAERLAGIMAIHIACGSWADAEYVDILYPKGLPAKERLSGYARHFDAVEVNSSYYATPRRETAMQWVKQTPKNFVFNIKLHRAFSQSPRKTAEEGRLLELLLEGIDPLLQAQKLGAFLLVLPPSFGPSNHGLAELDILAEKLVPHALAVELRDSDWVQGAERARTLDYFRERKLTWVAVDMPRIKGSTIMPPVDEVTAPRLAYIRLHGRNKGWLDAQSAAERHQHAYSTRELSDLARRVRSLADKAETVQVVANNHAEDFAPKAALALKQLLVDG
jgi:uncharacterized protein YecE (DUF72 family)